MLHTHSTKHHFATNVDCQTYPYLVSSSRKKTLQHVWIKVLEGGVILKLGKNDYFIQPNTSFWIPANCLVAATYLPNSRVQQVSFSQRLALDFAKNAGVVPSNAIVSGIFERLSNAESLDNSYLQVLALEACALAPSIELFTPRDKNMLALNGFTEAQSKTVTIACAIRDAKKSALSGSSIRNEIESIKALLGDQPKETWFAFTGETLPE
jgi:hypothetical protein